MIFNGFLDWFICEKRVFMSHFTKGLKLLNLYGITRQETVMVVNKQDNILYCKICY